MQTGRTLSVDHVRVAVVLESSVPESAHGADEDAEMSDTSPGLSAGALSQPALPGRCQRLWPAGTAALRLAAGAWRQDGSGDNASESSEEEET
jgi:hypothetical protein